MLELLETSGLANLVRRTDADRARAGADRPVVDLRTMPVEVVDA
jgi:hypothetical protein